MKTPLTTLCLCLCLIQQVLLAQVPIDFTIEFSDLNSVPHGNFGFQGEGTFTLTGTDLRYDIVTDFTHGVNGLYGPAAPGENAPFLYSMNRFTGPDSWFGCIPVPPGGGDSWCAWHGNLTIQPGQIPDLVNGLWYAEIPGVGRGQIIPVTIPEPSTLLLLGLAFTAILLRTGLLRRRRA